MATFTRTTRIEASPSEVWDVLGAVGDIAEWHPGLQGSHSTTDEGGGIGASRHCDIDEKQYVEETVVEWEPESALTVRVTESSAPLASADVRFQLEATDGATVVSATPDYTVKFGSLGRLMDALLVRRTFERGMDGLLFGLKRHVEGRTETAKASDAALAS